MDRFSLYTAVFFTFGTSLAAAGCGDSGSDPAMASEAGTAASADDTAGGPSGDDDPDTTGAADETGDADSGTDDPPMSGFGRPISGGGTAGGFATIPLMIGDDEYLVQTNPWGGAEQTITAGSGAVFRVDSITHPPGGNDWDVASFPSVFKGTNYGGDSTANSGLPLAISEISTVRTGLRANALGTGFAGNATYDVYFTNAPTYTGGPPDVYLMVWYSAKSLNPINGEGEGWDCSATPPTYIGACSGAGSTTIDGATIHRFRGLNGSAQVLSYVVDVPVDVWEFDLADFIDDAVEQGVLNSSMHLQSIQAGFEIADAGTGLTVEDFYIDVG